MTTKFRLILLLLIASSLFFCSKEMDVPDQIIASDNTSEQKGYELKVPKEIYDWSFDLVGKTLTDRIINNIYVFTGLYSSDDSIENKVRAVFQECIYKEDLMKRYEKVSQFIFNYKPKMIRLKDQAKVLVPSINYPKDFTFSIVTILSSNYPMRTETSHCWTSSPFNIVRPPIYFISSAIESLKAVDIKTIHDCLSRLEFKPGDIILFLTPFDAYYDPEMSASIKGIFEELLEAGVHIITYALPEEDMLRFAPQCWGNQLNSFGFEIVDGFDRNCDVFNTCSFGHANRLAPSDDIYYAYKLVDLYKKPVEYEIVVKKCPRHPVYAVLNHLFSVLKSRDK